jgi:DMSO/TMAO reductase YedYZ molybdopterin-dependent catalytic subunit
MDYDKTNMPAAYDAGRGYSPAVLGLWLDVISRRLGDKHYVSIDLDGAYHPQTILAYEMNDLALPIDHGAPLRLRDERQLGYEMAKYIMRIELVEDFARIGDGNGGYWEDQGYEWWAGI